MNLEPSRRLATIVYVVLTLIAISAAGTGLLYRVGSWPRRWPRPPIPLTDQTSLLTVGFVSLFACLCAVAAVVNGRRWHTAREVINLSRDPQLGVLLPDREKAPVGPFATVIPKLDVRFERPPRFRHRAGPLRKVTAQHNVLGHPPLQIVYLRVFENQPRSRTFVRGAWREFGYVHLLRSAAAVSPAQFRQAKRAGRLQDLFITSREQLTAALDRAPIEPQRPGWRKLDTIAGSTVVVRDRYGAYPVRSLMCHASFWKAALDDLLKLADLVVLDLSAYRTRYKGTQFELQRIIDTFPIANVLLLTDPWSNRRFLKEQVRLAWENMADGSPNAGPTPQTMVVAVTDYYVRIDQQSSSSETSHPHWELRASRAQTRWLLQDFRPRIDSRPREDNSRKPAIPPRRPDPSPSPPPVDQAPPRRGVVLVAAAVAVTVAACLGLALAFGWIPIGPNGIAASVRPGTAWNIRSGPSNSAPVVGIAQPGQRLIVACLHRGWAKLNDPKPGAFIYSNGLRMDRTPPAC